mmetsp:Transcript_2604/g.5593  ORF Transcript_2604/g.5593 Transcript_2604/m.5593 type:complete len:306 (-) Transcript_2604:1221-2138(-)
MNFCLQRPIETHESNCFRVPRPWLTTPGCTNSLCPMGRGGPDEFRSDLSHRSSDRAPTAESSTSFPLPCDKIRALLHWTTSPDPLQGEESLRRRGDVRPGVARFCVLDQESRRLLRSLSPPASSCHPPSLPLLLLLPLPPPRLLVVHLPQFLLPCPDVVRVAYHVPEAVERHAPQHRNVQPRDQAGVQRLPRVQISSRESRREAIGAVEEEGRHQGHSPAEECRGDVVADGDAREGEGGVGHPEFHLPGSHTPVKDGEAQGVLDLTEEVPEVALGFEHAEHDGGGDDDACDADAHEVHAVGEGVG